MTTTTRITRFSNALIPYFGITMRMKNSVPIADVAAIAGTSVHHIETHYRHIDDEVMIDSALRNFAPVRECGGALV